MVVQASIECCNALQKDKRDVLLLNTAVDAGISQELQRVTNYASDLLILRLSSEKTIELLNQLKNVCLGSRVVLNTILYFTRLCLFGVNAKKLGFREQVIYSWATMIWFTLFKEPVGADN
eukprot:12914073-Ditylum_brightwellii.AAC.1